MTRLIFGHWTKFDLNSTALVVECGFLQRSRNHLCCITQQERAWDISGQFVYEMASLFIVEKKTNSMEWPSFRFSSTCVASVLAQEGRSSWLLIMCAATMPDFMPNGGRKAQKNFHLNLCHPIVLSSTPSNEFGNLPEGKVHIIGTSPIWKRLSKL